MHFAACSYIPSVVITKSNWPNKKTKKDQTNEKPPQTKNKCPKTKHPKKTHPKTKTKLNPKKIQK